MNTVLMVLKRTVSWQSVPSEVIRENLKTGHALPKGLRELVKTLQPHTIIVYGSADYAFFDELKKQGINILSFSGQMAKAFERRKQDV